MTLQAPAALFDSEILHRGAPTPPLAAADGVSARDGVVAPLGAGWVSSCSVELCSAAGWEAWLVGTGGTTADPHDEAYRMLPISSTEDV